MSPGRKKIFLALMTVGGVALLIDRFVLSDGATEPRIAVALAENEQVGQVLIPDISTYSIPEVPFPRGLRPSTKSAPGFTLRDLFAPPPSNSEEGAANSTTDKNGERSDRDKHRGHVGGAMFVSQHRLNGVLTLKRLKIAVVDGTWMQIGQSMDGCTLVSILGNEARFECYDGQAVLRVTDAETFLGQD